MTSPKLRASVLGAVDGVISSFSVVASAYVASISLKNFMIIGFASLASDALSMGSSEYLSSRDALLGAYCFLSFLTFGSIPLATYAASDSVVVATVVSYAQLTIIGVVRSRITGESIYQGYVQASVIGFLCGSAAFGVSFLVNAL